jgi:ribosome biogenesis GTPase
LRFTRDHARGSARAEYGVAHGIPRFRIIDAQGYAQQNVHRGSLSAVPERSFTGRVIAVGRNAAWVVFDGESEPRLASLRKGDRHAEMIVPGDRVRASAMDDDRTVIDATEPRSFALIRHTPGGRTKTMAANIDTVAIVAAIVEPPLHLAMIDRLVAFATQHGVRSMLLLTKADLAPPGAADATRALYDSIGTQTLVLQPNLGEGIENLREAIKGLRALLVGNSGVGKSSIFKALGGIGVVGDLSKFGRGKQTTTSARLYELGGGFLIDSPGIGEFDLDPMPHGQLAKLFVEFAPFVAECRFSDCRHIAEPNCAVREAVESGAIAKSRYGSYREMVSGPGR